MLTNIAEIGASRGSPEALRSFALLRQRFSAGPSDGVVHELRRLAAEPPSRASIVVHSNLHSMYCKAHDAALSRTMDTAHGLVLFEGIALKIARFVTSGEWCPDVNGTDLVPRLLGEGRARPWRVALVGGMPGVAQRAAAALQATHPQVVVVAVGDGYGDMADADALRCRVRDAEPDLVLLGLGTPLQEATAAAWQVAGTAPLLWCVGGLFDYWAGVRARAPAWVRGLRLEWLWRLARSPGAMWRRTLVEGPWLVAQVLHHGLEAWRR